MITETKKKKSEITKTYIYEGALELFAEKGFENTTIRDMAKELNISLGSLYYHFKSKEAVLIHYYKRLQERTTQGVTDTLVSNLSSKKKVRKVMEVNLSLLKENASITKDLINSTSNVSHPLSPFGQELRECQESAIDLFRQALSKDHKPGEYLDCLAFLYWFYHLGICLMWANDDSKNNENTEKLINVTFPLTQKLITLTNIGVGRKLLIQLTQLIRSILMK